MRCCVFHSISFLVIVFITVKAVSAAAAAALGVFLFSGDKNYCRRKCRPYQSKHNNIWRAHSASLAML